MRDTFLTDAQAALFALLVGDAAKADSYLDNLTREEYRAMLVSKEIRVPSGISIAKRIIEHWLGQPVDAVLV